MDSDVLITAKNLYHAFDICPGFWKCLLHYHRGSRVFSIDRSVTDCYMVAIPRILCNGCGVKFREDSSCRLTTKK
ncbi:MAG: DUF4411 family protein [Gammaproteobacteria bacterium]|nr:DUF4411 family protein [Gammaproteobacteria bacterium]MCY4357147.1 DUF4411 family protein [Gammaproteobacteria bacterium]